MSLKTYGIIALAIGGVYGFQQVDKAMNYLETPAEVSNVEFVCSVESLRSHLEYKDTGKKAYLNCDLAKFAAEAHDYDESDIKLHAKLQYTWTSPADGSKQTKEHRTRVDSRDTYEKGQIIQIYAHKENPEDSYFK